MRMMHRNGGEDVRQLGGGTTTLCINAKIFRRGGLDTIASVCTKSVKVVVNTQILKVRGWGIVVRETKRIKKERNTSKVLGLSVSP